MPHASAGATRLRSRVGDVELTLSPLDVQDAQRLFALIEAGRPRLRPFLPWVDRTRGPEDVEAFLRNATDEAGVARHWGLRVDGELVGAIGLNRLDVAGSRASIGYWIGSAFEGRGLVTEACRLLIAHARDTLHVRRFELRIVPGNERSLAVARRLGFRFERLVPVDAADGGGVHEVHVLLAPARR
ncbi:MAG TPA: GNAT family N-acetyltransferase, partial [Candidatus Thermoplasmatota archaeon]|nr:GNAT family N-acetyltransferase [Candidatus Thermoplasmatota archaeon]